MTVTERPLYGRLELERLDGSTWVPYIADATRCSIRRGGTRTGLGIKTDVGSMSFTLHNAQDPLNGGAFKAGQTVRAVVQDSTFHPEVGHFEPGPGVVIGHEPVIEHPEAATYSYGFEDYVDGSNDGLDGWETPYGATHYVQSAIKRNGSYALHTPESAYSGKRFYLEIGKTYTISAWLYAPDGASEAFISALGSNPGPYPPVEPATWTRVSRTFIPIHDEVYVNPIAFGTGESGSYWDDITITRHAYTEGGEPIYAPGPDVWVVDEEAWTEVLETTPLFTGTVSDVQASYPLDKATGKKRTSVTIEVADAVKVHATTPRYGAMIGAPFYETFEQRIDRLSGSALAPIEPPPVGTPKVVYSF